MTTRMRLAMLPELLLREAALSVRRLIRNAGTSAAIIVTIACAAGPLAMAVGLFRSPRLVDSGVSDPDGLVQIYGATTNPGGVLSSRTLLAYPEFVEARANLRTVTSLAASLSFRGDVVANEMRQRATVAAIGGDYFRVLGARVALGPGINTESSSQGAEPQVVLSNEFWRRTFDSNAEAIGKRVSIDGMDAIIVGVAERQFIGFEPRTPVSVWLSLPLPPGALEEVPFVDAWDAQSFAVVGRLSKASSLAHLNSELRGFSQALSAESSSFQAKRQLIASFLGDSKSSSSSEVNDLTMAMWCLATMLLLIATFNIAGIFLVRAMSEERAAAIRIALGSSHARLALGLSLEALVLCFLGLGGAGMLAVWLLSLVRSQSDGLINGHVGRHFSVLVILVGLLVTCLLVSLPIAYWRRLNVAQAIVSSGHALAPYSRTSYQLLVSLQVAFSLVVATTAIILWRSMIEIRRADPGFSTAGLLMFSYDLRHQAKTIPELEALKLRMTETVRGVSGVRAAGIGLSPLLLHGAAISSVIEINSETLNGVAIDVVGPGYFEALGIAIREGRDFDQTDGHGVEQRVIVNESVAHLYWPAGQAVGKTIYTFPNGVRTFARVIGVVGDFTTDYVATGAVPRVFKSALQNGVIAGQLYVRADGRSATAEGVRSALQRLIGNNRVVPPGVSVDVIREDSMKFLKNSFLTIGVLAVLSLVIATMGVFALLSYTVARRSRELGIRLALGSQRSRIVLLVVLDGLRRAIAGAILAMPLSLAVSWLLRILVFRTGVWDPRVWLLSLSLMIVVVLLGCSWPALIAARCDPMTSIRNE